MGQNTDTASHTLPCHVCSYIQNTHKNSKTIPAPSSVIKNMLNQQKLYFRNFSDIKCSVRIYFVSLTIAQHKIAH